jgi:hypothetical protein
MLSNWVSFLAYPNLFGIKDFVVVIVVEKITFSYGIRATKRACALHNSSLCTFRHQLVHYTIFHPKMAESHIAHLRTD